MNNFHVLDLTKSVLLPAPTDPILIHLGHNHDNCNPNGDFNMDDEILRKFHQLFADANGCHIPFFGGDRFVMNVSTKLAFCTRKSDYNTSQGNYITLFIDSTQIHPISEWAVRDGSVQNPQPSLQLHQAGTRTPPSDGLGRLWQSGPKRRPPRRHPDGHLHDAKDFWTVSIKMNTR